MDNFTPENDTQRLLCEMADVQRRGQTLTWVATAALVLLALALIVSLVILVPRVTAALDNAQATMDATHQVIGRITESLDTLDSVGKSLEKFTGEGSENLQKLIDAFDGLDVDALAESIQSINGFLDSIANFRLF